MMAEPLPDPDVSVSSEESFGTHKTTVRATRPGANRGETRIWKGEGSTADRATQDVIEKIFKDPIAREFQ
jgi:hypothetical protein